MILKEAIPKFVEEKNIKELCKCVDTCRFRCNMNYEQIFKLFRKLTGITQEEFENLMQDIDEENSK